MRWVERMLADVVGQNTGVDSRLLRRVLRGRGKSVAIAGLGAAIGAALAQDQSGQRQPSAGGAPAASAPPRLPPVPTPGASTPAAPPPLPPVPTPAAASPPPAVPSQAPPVADADPEADAVESYAVVRTMVAAAFADSRLDPREHASIARHLDGSDLGAEREAQVRQDLQTPPSIDELAALTENPEHRRAMYRCACAVLLADGRVSTSEHHWLDALAGAFGFAPAERQALRDDVFGDEES
ncbi:MAG: DUF533 domain-containing protein [Acidobacteriota bacterium]